MTDLIDAAEVQQILGISPPTFYRWVRSGRLPGQRIGRRWRFRRSVIEEIAGLREPSADRVGVDAAAELFTARLGSDAPSTQTSNPAEPIDLARLALRHTLVGGAEALHLEPDAEGWRLRERIDGALVPLPRRLSGPAGVRLMTGLRALLHLNETDLQGRGWVTVGDRGVGVWLTIYPTPRGPSATIKLIEPGRVVPTLDELGLPAELITRLRVLLAQPTGVLVVNGPTGSGKSTTLYVLLRELARPDRKVMTVEDPVEVLLDGVLQGEAGDLGGFPAALDAMMRSDVDVALVSEIRDPDTLKRIMMMASTGHQVLTALHGPDALAAVRRLRAATDLPPGILADAVVAVLDQRLAPRSCPACRTQSAPTADELRVLTLPADTEVSRNAGCDACDGRGTRGRVPVASLLSGPRLAAALRGEPDPSGAGLRPALEAAVCSGMIRPEEALALWPSLEADAEDADPPTAA